MDGWGDWDLGIYVMDGYDRMMRGCRANGRMRLHVTTDVFGLYEQVLLVLLFYQSTTAVDRAS